MGEIEGDLRSILVEPGQEAKEWSREDAGG